MHKRMAEKALFSGVTKDIYQNRGPKTLLLLFINFSTRWTQVLEFSLQTQICSSTRAQKPLDYTYTASL